MQQLTPEQIQEVFDEIDRAAGPARRPEPNRNYKWAAVQAKRRVRALVSGAPLPPEPAPQRLEEEFDAGPVTDPHGEGVPDPTPDELAERAAAVRAEWSDSERRRREMIPPVPWRLRTFSFAELR